MLKLFRRKPDPAFADRTLLEIVTGSGLFDPDWYARQHPHAADMEGGPIAHFCRSGLDGHLDPGPNFSTRRYLDSLGAEAATVARPFLHAMETVGAGTTRPPWLPDDLDSFAYLLRGCGLFDGTWYLAANPDVARAGLDAGEHFVRYGAIELRDPGPAFASRSYAERYPDYVALCRSPMEHYLRIGRETGCRPGRTGEGRSRADSGAPRNDGPPPDMPDFRVERRDTDLSTLEHDGLQALIADLDARADRLGCVVFDPGRHADRVVVVFAGNRERFHMLSVAARLACRVIYVQDFESGWYQGSRILPDLTTFCERFLVTEVGRARALLFGQSSGAYAALVASTHLVAPTVVACAPQTFSDGPFKAGIGFVGVRALSTPDGLIDLNPVLRGRVDPEALRVVAIAAGELENPITAHYWMDYLHCLRIADAPSVSAFVVKANTHVIVHGRVRRFAHLLERLVPHLSATTDERHAIVASFLTEVFQVDAA